MACLSAPAPGTISTTCVRYITGRIISAACGIHIASMIATGSLSAMRDSMSGASENSAGMILIVDAGSMKRGNLTDVILIAGVGLTVGAESGKTGAAILTAAHRIGAVDMSAAKAVGAVADKGKSKVG